MKNPITHCHNFTLRWLREQDWHPNNGPLNARRIGRYVLGTVEAYPSIEKPGCFYLSTADEGFSFLLDIKQVFLGSIASCDAGDERKEAADYYSEMLRSMADALIKAGDRMTKKDKRENEAAEKRRQDYLADPQPLEGDT